MAKPFQRHRRDLAIGTPCPLCGVTMTPPPKGRLKYEPTMVTIDHILPRHVNRALGYPVRARQVRNTRILCCGCNLLRAEAGDCVGAVAAAAAIVGSWRHADLAGTIRRLVAPRGPSHARLLTSQR